MMEQCRIWLRRAPPVTARNDLRLLDESERSATQRVATEPLRARHACAHALLRHALAQSLGLEPSSFRFEPGRNDRPRLAGISHELDFNLSHSGPYVACAVSRSGMVGIDVETINHKMDYARILSHVASTAERSWLQTKVPGEARRAFFRLWVLKEAYAKARGDGLNLPFTEVTLMPRGSDFVLDLEATGDNPDDWVFALYDVNREASMAIAVKPRDTQNAGFSIRIMQGSELLV